MKVNCTCTAADRAVGRRCYDCRLSSAVDSERRRCLEVVRQYIRELVASGRGGLVKVAEEVAKRLGETAVVTEQKQPQNN